MTLDGLPLCPIWSELSLFIGTGVMKHPNLEIRYPLNFYREYAFRVSYNYISLNIAITHAAIPCFRETTNGRFPPEYFYARKTSQLRMLARSIFHTHDFRKGEHEGRIF